MAGIAVTSIADLVNSVRNKIKPDIAITQTYSKYEFCNAFLQGEVETDFEGDTYKWDVLTTTSGQAADVDLYEEQNISIVDVLSQASMGPRFTNTHWAFDDRARALNSGEAKAVDFIKAQKTASLLSWADLQEENAWNTLLSTSTKKPYNFPYYLPKLASGQAATAYGFYGGSDTTSGFTDVAGIDPATSNDNTTTITGGIPRWRSWQAGYTAMDLTAVDQMKTTFRNINFQSPEVPSDMQKIAQANFRIYMNNDTINEFERLARNQNDAVGPDVAEFMGRTTFKRLAPRYVPLLDSDAYDPIYFINLNDFAVKAVKGQWLKEHPAQVVSARAHNQFVVWIDAGYNLACYNRRGSGVVNKTA